MNLPVVASGLLGVVLLVLGWPGAQVAARTPAWSLAAVPAVAGLVAAFGVMISVLTEASLSAALVPVALAGWMGWVMVVIRRTGTGTIHDPRVRPGDEPGLAVLLVAVATALVPVVLVDIPPVGSDARFIWWFHAAWFRGGGAVARDGLSHPAFAPTHPGYPPAAPGLIASVWHLADAYDRELALRVSQLLTAAAVAAAGFFTAAVLRLPRRRAMVVAAVVVGVAWGTNVTVGLLGFVDVLWAALLVGAAVLLLCGPVDRRTIVVGALFAAAAALTKYEAGGAAALLVAVAAARAGRDWRRVLPVALAVGGSLAAWVTVTAVSDVPSEDRGDWSALADLADPTSAVRARAMETIGHLAGELGPLVGFGALAVVVLVALARLSGTPLRQPGLLSLLGLAGGYLVFLTGAVTVAPLPLEEYTDYGNYRTVIAIRMLVVVDVVVAVVASARALGWWPPAATPDVVPCGSVGPRASTSGRRGAEAGERVVADGPAVRSTAGTVRPR